MIKRLIKKSSLDVQINVKKSKWWRDNGKKIRIEM